MKANSNRSMTHRKQVSLLQDRVDHQAEQIRDLQAQNKHFRNIVNALGEIYPTLELLYEVAGISPREEG